MAGVRQSAHGSTTRGLTLARGSKFFGGQFGRMFRALPPADFGETDSDTVQNLMLLGEKMVADPDPPKDGPDDEESGIPAAYTYLGQFVDHDLTFDPASSLQQQDDPDGLIDFRTPRFDLDCLYGKGPDDAPYLYTADGHFIQGRPLTGAASNPQARDLPRSQPLQPNEARRAIIGDPRNDENVIVSQLQGLFHRFHNKLMDQDAGPQRNRFQRVQREVRFHYQWMLINDFLPRIVWEPVLKDVIPHHFNNTNVRATPPNLIYFDLDHEPTMPLEFAAAAYRFGHSMVRPGYRLSDTVGVLPIFSDQADGSLQGFHEFPGNWAFDWARFIDLTPLNAGDETKPATDPANTRRLQLAYKIDTSLVDPLGHLPVQEFDPPLSPVPVPISSPGPTKIFSLAQRNLLRGWRMRLPSGQAVAHAMGVTPLKDADIKIGKFTGNQQDIRGSITDVSAAFAGNCPLWTYILAETNEVIVNVNTAQGDKPKTTRQLGAVGGRIVAETFAGLMLADENSYFNQDPIWKPSKANAQGRFGLKELIQVALS